MDMFVVASFVGFFAMVLAWLVAPATVKLPAVVIEPAAVGAD
jgi:hypothetical protein